jgi:hypothetical protein
MDVATEGVSAMEPETDTDVIEARRRRAEADAEFDAAFDDAQRRMIIAEFQRREFELQRLALERVRDGGER